MRHLVCLVIVFSATALWAGSPQDDPLAHLRTGHPRLLLTDA
jgi:hypothetical protein